MLTEDKYARGILRELYLRGALTRKQIMANLPMRLNSLVAMSNRLEAEGFIFRTEVDRQRNVPLELHPRRFASVGVEHGENFAVFALLNSSAERIGMERVSLPQELGGVKRLRRIMDFMDDFIRRNSEYEVFMLGFADIGIVNTESGVGVYSAHIPDWENVPLQAELESRFRCFCRVVDRSGASALDHLRLHQDDERVRNSLQIFVGNGIGATILQNGRYFGEDTPSSCQLGHIIVNPGGKLCHCGSHGCLETMSSILAIVSRVSQLSNGKISTKAKLLAALADGNKICEAAVCEAGRVLGIAIANTVTFTGITNVYLRCELCRASQNFLESVREALLENVIRPFRRKVHLAVSSQEEDSAAVGAAFYTQHEFFAGEK
ncbi:MAG TPA: ROK family protein [Lentisphaeria bacterium]|nr:ROK family protein [Lentisphaeria bacterium]